MICKLIVVFKLFTSQESKKKDNNKYFLQRFAVLKHCQFTFPHIDVNMDSGNINQTKKKSFYILSVF